MRERALPCFVFGPVDLFAFRRFAALAFSDVGFRAGACEFVRVAFSGVSRISISLLRF